MWYAPATCRYGHEISHGWMPQRVGEDTGSSQGGYTPPSSPATVIQGLADAANTAVMLWHVAEKHALQYHADYLPALKANTAAQNAESALSTAAFNEALKAPNPATSPFKAYVQMAADAQADLQAGRAALVADMAAHYNLKLGAPSGLPSGSQPLSPGVSPSGDASKPGVASGQEAAAGAIDKTKNPNIPPPPVSPDDPAIAGAPLEWGQIAMWTAIVGVGGWIFWRVVSGAGLG